MRENRAPIQAYYVSACAGGCGSMIYIGDNILATDDDRWAHAECIEDVESIERQEKPTRFEERHSTRWDIDMAWKK